MPTKNVLESMEDLQLESLKLPPPPPLGIFDLLFYLCVSNEILNKSVKIKTSSVALEQVVR